MVCIQMYDTSIIYIVLLHYQIVDTKVAYHALGIRCWTAQNQFYNTKQRFLGRLQVYRTSMLVGVCWSSRLPTEWCFEWIFCQGILCVCKNPILSILWMTCLQDLIPVFSAESFEKTWHMYLWQNTHIRYVHISRGSQGFWQNINWFFFIQECY